MEDKNFLHGDDFKDKLNSEMENQMQKNKKAQEKGEGINDNY